MIYREWVEGACAAVANAEVDLELTEMPGTPESRNSLTVTKLKVNFKNLNIFVPQ